MQSAHLLVVCTANICRSPMAERLFAELFVRGDDDVEVHVSSAGTHARPGDAAASGMQRIAQKWGLDLSYHRSRRVDEELVARQDLIVTMEDAHRSVVARLGAGIGQRTFTITELGELVGDDDATGPAPGGLPAAVAGWHAARARRALHAPDVDDPYGRSQQDYERCAWQLADLVQQVGPAITAAMTGSGRRTGRA